MVNEQTSVLQMNNGKKEKRQIVNQTIRQDINNKANFIQ